MVLFALALAVAAIVAAGCWWLARMSTVAEDTPGPEEHPLPARTLVLSRLRSVIFTDPPEVPEADRRRRRQTEYALVIILVFVACIVAIQITGSSSSSLRFHTLPSAIQ
jgi:hypothetical protein